MKKSTLTHEAVQKFHQIGQLDAAKEGYLTLLKASPHNAELLHALGILYAQQNDFSTACHYLKQAVHYEQHNPTLYLHLANALKMQGLLDEAAEILQKAIQLNPDYSAALNNLGILYFSQENFVEAIKCYQLAIEKQPNFWDAYYNLGLAFSKTNQFNAAIATYETLVKQTSDHSAAYFQLGRLYLHQERIDDAITYFQRIAEAHPDHAETQINLATCYLKKSALKEAKSHYLQAMKLTPADTQILFNLGIINMQQGLTDNAIQYYQRAIQLDPDYFAAHNNLGVAFLAKQHSSFALHHFKEAQRLQPTNKAIGYAVQMLSENRQLSASPPEYITTLFDAYADHYEQHLLEGLDYQVPQLLFQAITKNNAITKKKMDILDLGCGTGLCGISFKPLAKTLTGVDLSPNMITIARQKKIYDDLAAEDLLLFLQQKNTSYDLIIAGDVFVYIGDLNPVFTAMTDALRTEGLIAFNTEIASEEDFTMNQSGRFSHKKTYLDHLAATHNLAIIDYEQVITRQQNNEPVHGHIYVLKKY
jgi:predicted TPR repeat methyltransferase